MTVIEKVSMLNEAIKEVFDFILNNDLPPFEAGIEAGKLYKDIQMPGKLNMNHVDAFCKEREAAKIDGEAVSPKLLPSYARK